jgi:hypothetical protein
MRQRGVTVDGSPVRFARRGSLDALRMQRVVGEQS